MDDASRATLIRREHDLPEETFTAVPGGTTWRTLFDRSATRTVDLASGVATVPAGGSWPSHHHPVAECYYFLGGEGSVRVGPEHHQVSEGTAVMVPAGVPHGVVNTGTRPLRFLYVLPVDSLDDVEYTFEQ